jgi:hypothetical protein
VLLYHAICNFPRTVVASFASLRMNILLRSSALAFLHGQDPIRTLLRALVRKPYPTWWQGRPSDRLTPKRPSVCRWGT